MVKSNKMTQGSIYKSILFFSFPIFIGQLFQNLYSIIDTYIIGQYDSLEGLSAVNSTGSLNFLFFGFISGLFTGAGVLISKYFGSKEYEKLSKSVHTAIAFAVVMGLTLSVASIFFTKPLLQLIKTPSNVLNQATTYLSVIFFGAIFTVGFNCCAGILQAVGDSKKPLYFLMVSTIVNILLDFLFVAILNMGVFGAGVATVIAQSVSCLCAVVCLIKTKGVHKLIIKQIRFYKGYTTIIIKYGLPAGIQNSFTSIANTFVQASVNSFGYLVMAGTGLANKVQRFAFIPVNSFCLAITTFISQNLGAKRLDRVKKGMVFGIVSGVVFTQLIGVITFVFADQLIGFFVEENSVDAIIYGVQKLRIEAFFYFALAFSHCSVAALRGFGKSFTPMIIMFSVWCVFRVIFIEITINLTGDYRFIYIAYPVTWTITSIIYMITLLSNKKLKNQNKIAKQLLSNHD